MDRLTFKEACRTRRVSWGTVMFEFMVPHTVRLMARAGFEWLWIDNEHSCHSYESIIDVARAAEDLGIMSILRVAQDEYPRIAQAYDMGVSGIIVPRVETPEQMRHIIDCAKFPPVGRRGFGLRSSIIGKMTATMQERIADQHNTRFLFIQIESRQGLVNLDAILDVADGHLDGVFFGPADFQMDLGAPDTPDHPELVAAVQKVVEISKARGLSNGVPVHDADGARKWRDYGFNLITVGSDEAFLARTAAATRASLQDID
ncbi:MAG: hypothetical protein GY851_20175 [bacterium]|nr:hypothetical protein [bacterium]